MKKRIAKDLLDHPVARVCGVAPSDTHGQAAEKVIKTMRMAGMPVRAIRNAEAMLAAARARGLE